jgi:hypothetical protein
MDIIIEEKFKCVLPKLENSDIQRLEESILENGLRDSLVTWNGILVDGHNRHEICIKHNIPYSVIELSPELNEDEVMRWILNNQLSRRNLNAKQRTYFIGKMYNSQKGSHGGERSSSQNDNLKTCDIIAKDQNVCSSSVVRAGAIAEAIDKIANTGGLPLRDKILTQELPISNEIILGLAKINDDEILKNKVDFLSTGKIVYPKPVKFPGNEKTGFIGICPHCSKEIEKTDIQWVAKKNIKASA